MKNQKLSLSAIVMLTFLIFSACSPSRRADREAEKKAATTQLTKDVLREVIFEREANRKKNNVQCDYSRRPGIIVITNTEMAENDRVRVFYDFKPDAAAPNEEEFRLGNTNRVMSTNTGLPTKSWCEKNAVVKGARFPAVRLEIIKGHKTASCFPVEYEIPLLKQN